MNCSTLKFHNLLYVWGKLHTQTWCDVCFSSSISYRGTGTHTHAVNMTVWWVLNVFVMSVLLLQSSIWKQQQQQSMDIYLFCLINSFFIHLMIRCRWPILSHSQCATIFLFYLSVNRLSVPFIGLYTCIHRIWTQILSK